MVVLRRILLVVVGAFLAWRVVSYGVSEYYLDQAGEEDVRAIDRALAWNPRQPDALYRRAQKFLEKDSASSSKWLKQSFAENPSSSFPLLALAGMARNAGEQAQARALVEISSQLMPASPRVQIAAGGYWANSGNLNKAIRHWSQALEASSKTSHVLFPILLKLSEESKTVGLFRSLAASPPSWWERFFREVSQRALDLETVRTLYAFRRAAGTVPLTGDERRQYVKRLQRDGRITEAYLVWVNGLDEEERAHLGILHNGGFEITPTNSGFDWHLQVTNGVATTSAATAGIEGEKALHLVFKHRERPFRHVYQPLFLDPGAYLVRGMVRADGLDSHGGLKWVVRCLFPKPNELAESERFLGSSEWREFSFEVRVPEECAAQEIRLVSAGRRLFEYKMTGGIWFDAMSMRKIQLSQIDIASSSSNEALKKNDAGRTTDGDFQALEATGGRVFSLGPSLRESLGISGD